ncbi:hypothetical protein FA95DRAFT_1558908 [Auriscalpium vulgare]|uniref:Uncharacterized protein n=1 Tax=Auriscalpium vulgare TaxID=40419 RepID=A0ACB8RVM6_9AGAM|nr:hypothetical protein FA95DRAFT_1558908 [Auriscalpium vulgare]
MASIHHFRCGGDGARRTHYRKPAVLAFEFSRRDRLLRISSDRRTTLVRHGRSASASCISSSTSSNRPINLRVSLANRASASRDFEMRLPVRRRQRQGRCGVVDVVVVVRGLLQANFNIQTSSDISTSPELAESKTYRSLHVDKHSVESDVSVQGVYCC